jgi:uncharacterized protein YbjT (DUF2867 family)
MSYKSFAVVGGGKIGMPIVKALAAQNVAVVLLSRSGLDAARLESIPAGATVATVDTTDAAAVAAVFGQNKVEVVISTITTAAVGAQTVLVDAAKGAGVKLFAPSEFGMSTEGDINNHKNKTIGMSPSRPMSSMAHQETEYIKTSGVPYARFFVSFCNQRKPSEN